MVTPRSTSVNFFIQIVMASLWSRRASVVESTSVFLHNLMLPRLAVGHTGSGCRVGDKPSKSYLRRSNAATNTLVKRLQVSKQDNWVVHLRCHGSVEAGEPTACYSTPRLKFMDECSALTGAYPSLPDVLTLFPL